MIRLSSLFALAPLLSIGALAQHFPGPPPPPPPGFEGQFKFQGGDFAFVKMEFGMEGRLVKGSPYSAQVVTEFTQTLADGNRIHRTTSGSFARDSEGRTRREQSIGAIGALATSEKAAKSVFIQDPVSGTDYILEPNSRVARAMPAPKRFRPESAMAQNAAQEKMRRAKPNAQSEPDVKMEDLGTQVMESVTVQGKRVTRTIPAGQIGNERPLQVVTETWYSPDLQAVVMSKTTDPRSGESVYKLTGVSRSEPDHSLFEVPSDYTVSEPKPMGRPGRMPPPAK